MLLEDLSEAGEVEVLVVLQEDEAEVELTEGQLQVMNLACVDLDLLCLPVEGPHQTQSAPSCGSHIATQPMRLQLADVVVQLGLEVAELSRRLC